MKSSSMKNSILALTALFACGSLVAQTNLVDNGGFESNNGKIKKLGQIDLAEPWMSPTGVRADVFLSDAKDPLIGTAANAYGKEAPKEGENYAVIAQLQKTARFENPERVITIDGLRVEYKDGFGLARSSNTMPVIVLRFEADNQAALERIQNDFRRVILEAKPDAVLPY